MCVLAVLSLSVSSPPIFLFISSSKTLFSLTSFVSQWLNVADWVSARVINVDLVAEEVANVANVVIDHGGPFERQTPGDHAHIFRQAHRFEHLGTEHTRVSNFDPRVQLRMESKDFERGLGVRVIGRLKLEILNSDPVKEGLHDAQEMFQADVLVNNHAFDLVELGQVSCVEGFVAEHAID